MTILSETRAPEICFILFIPNLHSSNPIASDIPSLKKAISRVSMGRNENGEKRMCSSLLKHILVKVGESSPSKHNPKFPALMIKKFHWNTKRISVCCYVPLQVPIKRGIAIRC